MTMGEIPTLRIVSLSELDDLAKLNEPVEDLARTQAAEIINDIKVRMQTIFGYFDDDSCSTTTFPPKFPGEWH